MGRGVGGLEGSDPKQQLFYYKKSREEEDVQDTKTLTPSDGHIETNVLARQAEQVEAFVTLEYFPANIE